VINTSFRLDHYIGDVKRINREQCSGRGGDADGVAYHNRVRSRVSDLRAGDRINGVRRAQYICSVFPPPIANLSATQKR
jgi:hypothetical protein